MALFLFIILVLVGVCVCSIAKLTYGVKNVVGIDRLLFYVMFFILLFCVGALEAMF